jgi:hypothetical protein
MNEAKSITDVSGWLETIAPTLKPKRVWFYFNETNVLEHLIGCKISADHFISRLLFVVDASFINSSTPCCISHAHLDSPLHRRLGISQSLLAEAKLTITWLLHGADSPSGCGSCPRM